MCKRYGGKNHEDLKSEVLQILLELPKEKQNQIIENDYILPYSLQIARFQVSNKNWTRFRKLYCNREELIFTDEFIELVDEVIEESPINLNLIINKIKEDMREQTNKYFYHSRLLYELIESGKNTKQLSRDIGIPYTSVRYALQEYRITLKEWLQKSAL